MYDVIIKNGTVIDGSGKTEKFKADVAIQGGAIARIGAFSNADAKETIDAKGMYVTPGFIDVLSHSDTYLTLFTAPKQESLVTQGVTTIIGGNCGYSLAPLVSGGVINSAEQWTDPSQINIDWLRMSEYLEKVKEKKCAINFGTLTGYNTIIKGVLKGDYRQSSSQENEIAAFLLEQSLEEGSFGMSLGLAYLFQDRHFLNHLESLFAVIRKHRRILTVHLRDESNQFLDSLASTLRLAEEYEVKLHISHLKVIGKPFWPNFTAAVRMIDDMTKRGSSVTFDVFPYASSGLSLYLLLPAWVKVGGPVMILKRLRNSFDRKQIAKDIAALSLEYDRMIIASRAPDEVFIGKSIADIAGTLGLSGEETIIELLLGSQARIIVFAHVLDETNVEAGIIHPLSIIASSGAGYGVGTAHPRGDLPHPRSFGTFPRFLKKYVREGAALGWEEAVAKISGAPADLFGVKNRGYIKEGYHADVVVFDPGTIADLAIFQDPYHYSKGVRAVLVNGVSVYEAGAHSGRLPGSVLFA